MYDRFYKYLKNKSFFLFGPRGAGKSTWLKTHFPDAVFFDLLDEGLFQDYLRDPGLFKKQLNLLGNDNWIIIDEIQRLPALLNYVHQSIVEKNYKFILTGSSARKLKKENANLLAGRALQRFFNPLSAFELGKSFDIQKSLVTGHLPEAYTSEAPKEYLKSYVGTYLREEIQQERIVRNLAVFASFLEAMAMSQGQIVSAQAIAGDIGVDRKTVESYIQILEDLLIGQRIPVFQKRAKRKMTIRPKFYYFDVGVFRTLRKRGPLDVEDELLGVSLETLVYQELKFWIDAAFLDLEIFFYRTQSQHEVDFVLYGESGFYAFEVKKSARVRESDFQSLRLFKEDYPEAKLFLLYGGDHSYKTEDQIEVWPVQYILPKIGEILCKDFVVKSSSTQTHSDQY